MNRAALLFLLAAPACALDGLTVTALLEEMSSRYRAGDVPGALERATRVLELDPLNPDAKSYLWTLGRALKEEDDRTLTDDERKAILSVAMEDLESRKKETERVLGEIKIAFEKSGHMKSPQDLLAGAQGFSQFLGGAFEEERNQALAQSTYQRIIENLSTALRGKVFVGKKEQYVARAWLSYYTHDWKKSLAWWQRAAAEEPSDREVLQNAEKLKVLLKKQEDEKRIREWESQALTYQDTGFHREAFELWSKIMAVDNRHPAAVRNREACREKLAAKEREKRLAALTEEGVRLYQEGNSLEAAQTWFRVLEQDPAHREARVWLGHVGKRLRAPDQKPALPAVKVEAGPAAASAPNESRAQELYTEGLILYTQNKVVEAVSVWESCLKHKPDHPQALQALRQARAELSYKRSQNAAE